MATEGWIIYAGDVRDAVTDRVLGTVRVEVYRASDGHLPVVAAETAGLRGKVQKRVATSALANGEEAARCNAQSWDTVDGNGTARPLRIALHQVHPLGDPPALTYRVTHAC